MCSNTRSDRIAWRVASVATKQNRLIMSYILLTLVLVVVTTVAPNPAPNALQDITGFAASELLTVKDPVDKAVFGVLSDACTPVKELLQAGDDQMEPPDLSKLTLDLYTRDVHIEFKLSAAAELIPASPWFRNQSRIIIFMHGFTKSPSDASFQDINNAFLKKGDYNVLALDSSSLLGLSTLYIGATTNVRYIGEKLGAVLANLTKVGSSPSSMYLIGHSLGAHIAGFASKTLAALTGARVGRITGLDPAGPCYTVIDDDLKLKSTDADFVDVMHTNAGAFGLNEQIGDADFYPNDGSLQEGCFTQVCSHNRAYELYAETVVVEKAMPAVACDSWDKFKDGLCNDKDISLMGYGCDPKTRGRYYLQTNGDTPFGLGPEGLTYRNKNALF